MDVHQERAVTAEVWTEEVDVGPRRQANLWREAWRRLLKNRLAMFGLIGVILLIILAIGADLLSPGPFDFQHFDHIEEPPSWEFPFGTDLVGRDMLSRMIYGARVS